MMSRENYVKDQLEKFTRQHDPDASISVIDEIVLNYVVSVLEELGSPDAGEDAFDQEDFIQMMEAYLPVFSQLDSVVVSEWMFDLANKLANPNEVEDAEETKEVDNESETLGPFDCTEENSSTEYLPLPSLPQVPENQFKLITQPDYNFPDHVQCLKDSDNNQCKFERDETTEEKASFTRPSSNACRQRTLSSTSLDSQGQSRSRKSSQSSEGKGHKSRSRRTSHKSSTSETDVQCNGASAIGDDEDLANDEEIKLLLEMFPASCALEAAHCMAASQGDLEEAAHLMLAAHCMAASQGDLEEAAHLMLVRQESQQHITAKAAKQKKPKVKRVVNEPVADEDMKKHIVNKYSYVDVDDDKKQHRPVLQKEAGKKLVRYLDGKVVSTRGEKFTEIKKSEDEEKMKKTFVNLKPARQYRFH